MRKLIIWLGKVPASIKSFSNQALKITEKVLLYVDSDAVKIIVKATPTDVDDILRQKISDILKALVPVLKAASDKRAQKAIASRIGAEIVAEMDGRKESMGTYVTLFEKTLNNA